jgi:hypothetical protein
MDDIDSLKARIAALEEQLAPKPERDAQSDLESFIDRGTKDPFGMRRDGRGKPIPREVEEPTSPPDARAIQLKAKFDHLTRGCFEPGSWQYETELDHYIEADGNYRPSLWRDPMGIIRNRDGERVSTAAAEREEAREIMAEMAKEAHRLKG